MNRIREIRLELDALMRELGGDRGEEESPEKRRAALRLLKGGLILVLIGASLGMAHAAGWTVRHVRTVAAAAVTAGAAGVIAGALLAQGSPTPHLHAGVPPVTARATASVYPPRPSAAPSSPSSAAPSPRRTRSVPPAIPVLLPSRSRRASATATGTGAPTPADPSPSPSAPVPSPTGSPPPSPTPLVSCAAGLQLEMLGLGVFVCV